MATASVVRSIPRPELLEEESFGPDGWAYREWPDGVDQWMHVSNFRLAEEKDHDYIVERVLRPKSRRTKWVIVDRNSPDGEMYEECLYPPKVAGPFPSAEAAKLACLLLIASSR